MKRRDHSLKKKLMRVHGVQLRNENELYFITLRHDTTLEQVNNISDMLKSFGVLHFVLQIADKSGKGVIEFARVEGK